MFFAINAKTNDKVNSLTLEQNNSYPFPDQEVWYADPDEIESCPPEIDVNKIQVKFREGSTDHISSLGKKFDISPHFYIINKSKLNINTIPESKEHKLSKNWIYNQLKSKNLKINYSQVTKPYKYKNSINLFDLPLDEDLIGIEINSTTFGKKVYRRADIICPFIIKHPLLGNGIVFEIQFSKQKQTSKLDRELDWAIRGYSVAWLFFKDFEKITENIIELKKDSVDVSSFSSLIKKNNKDQIRNLKFTIQEEMRKLEYKKQEIKESINYFFESRMEDNSLKYIIQDSIKSYIDKLQPTCPKCRIPLLLKCNRTNKNKKFWGCSNYPNCGITMIYSGS